jgi:hypothetical protein
MLALDVALAFTKRWPSSVATTAVNRVLSLREMDLRTNERTDVSNLLGEGVDLMVTTMPALSAVILEYGGILIPDFGADQEIAQQWAREMNLRPDPSKGRILGFVFEPSTSLRKFVGGSHDPGERPSEILDERLDQTIKRSPDTAWLPSARVGRHLEHPDVGGDPSEARVGDGILGLAGLHDDEIRTPTDAEMFEPVARGEGLPYLLDVAVFGEDLGHGRRGRFMPPARLQPSSGSP